MKKLFIEPEDILPGIRLDKDAGKLNIYGKSCPANAHEFFKPVFEWIDEYIDKPNDSTVLELYLSYFNTVSAKVLLNIMTKMQELAQSGKSVVIKWMFNANDEILFDAGLDFEKIVDVDFEFIAIVDEEDNGNDNNVDNLIDGIS